MTVQERRRTTAIAGTAGKRRMAVGSIP